MADRFGRVTRDGRLAGRFDGRRVRRAWLAAGLIALLGTACSPSQDEGDQDQLQSEPAPASATTDPPATTTEPTTATTTTAPTTTTIVKPSVEVPISWDSLQDEIFGRYLLYVEANNIAVGPPQIDPNYPDLGMFLAPQALEETRAGYSQVSEDEVFIIKEDWRDRRLLRIGELPTQVDEGLIVPMQDCWLFDYDIERLDGTLVSSHKGATLKNIWMIYQDGEWVVNSLATADERSGGYEDCKVHE